MLNAAFGDKAIVQNFKSFTSIVIFREWNTWRGVNMNKWIFFLPLLQVMTKWVTAYEIYLLQPYAKIVKLAKYGA